MSRRLKQKTSPGKPAAAHFNPDIQFSGKRDWIFGLVLVLAVIAAYQPVWHGGFIWDDDFYVTGNRLLSAPDGLWRIWFSFDSPSQYFPLTYTVFRLEHALWGLNPAGYHWVNILLHATNALLVWRLLRRLDLPGAWLAAAIWALHPVQVESVAWITELKNVLMCFFFLLTLLAWIGFVEGKPEHRWNFYAVALGFYALALSSKTTGCTLPAALLLILWLKGRPINRQQLALIIPFVLLGVGMGLLTMWWERYHQGTQGQFFAMGVMDRILVASRAVWFYAGKLFWPVNLTFSYPRWTISASDPLAYIWLIMTAGFGAAIYCMRRYVGRSIGVAVLFFAATLSPVLGFIMLYTFFYTFVADHYQYVACLGLIVLAAAGITATFGWLGKGKPFLKPVFCGALVLLLGILTWRQCRMYADVETLWQTTLRLNPNSWMAQANLGNALFQKGSVDEAIVHFQRALQIKPDYAEACYNLGNALLQKGSVDEAIAYFQKALQIRPDDANAHNNLGNALLQKGKVDEAIAHFQKALQIEPDDAEAHINLGSALLQKGKLGEAIAHYEQALQIEPDDAEACYNLGNALRQTGKLDEAVARYQQALQIKPGYVEAHNNLGQVLLQKGSVDEAITHFQKALEIKPGSAGAHFNLGIALFREGNAGEAIVHYQQALQIKPDYLEAQNNLAWMLATSPQASLRNGPQAVELAQRANQLAGGENPIILHTLAAAYAEVGQFDDARRSVEKAIGLAQAAGRPDLVKQLNIELKLYEAGQPFHLENK